MNENRRNGRPQRRQPAARMNNSARQQHNGTAGNAHRNYERYVALGREALANGDRVEAENYYQHAEHFFRVMRERSG
jgi:uncharacterized protein DUF4167